MSDIWQQSRIPIPPDPGTWRCRVGAQMLGPMSLEALVDKLLSGAIDEATPVARETDDFFPLLEVAALSPYVPAAREAREARLRRKGRRQKLGIGAAVGLLLLLAAWGSRQALQQRQRQQRAEAQAMQTRVAEQSAVADRQMAAAAAAARAAEPMALEPIVSLGTPEQVRLGPRPPSARPPRRRPGRDRRPPLVQGCQLSQKAIFAGLKSVLLPLNRCVVLAKRGPQQALLPERLELSFVVLPEGRVVDFAVGQRRLQQGALRDCLAEVFSGLHFPATHGASCPVGLPLKLL
jgi:hypothetical protein